MASYLVTGASSGIGLATAHALAHKGGDLVLVGRDRSRLQQVAEQCRHDGVRCVTVTADVREPRAVEAAFATGAEQFGRIDGVVHCAAVTTYGRFDEVPDEIFAATHATTFLGAANVARAALRRFRQQGGGRLVLVGSLLGDIAVPYMSAYVSAKWALHGLTRVLQMESRGQDIDVCLVSPGGVDTPIYDNAATYVGAKGQAPGTVSSADEVAARILTVLERPRRQVQSGRLNRPARLAFRTMPQLFDVVIGPFMRWQGLRPESHPATAGNVLDPASGPLRTKGEHMKNTRVIHRDVAAPVTAVWSVLCDGWSYATWVVGASRVRDVDEHWPAAGSRIHHSFGPWPAVIQDYTRAEVCLPEQELVLTARGWPAGEARVIIRMAATSDHSCRVSIEEDAVAGPGKALPTTVRQSLIGPRNKETLYRLALIAEGRYRNHEAA